MKSLTSLLVLLINICLLRGGQGLVLSTQPPSGTLIANFEGTENAITLVCNISGDGSTQIGTTWSIANYRGSIALVDITGGPEPFDVGGPPNPLAPQVSLSNELTISNWTADLDGATIFCGTGQDQQEASFLLRVYRPPNLRDNFLVLIEENSENIPVDLRQEPAAFPEPTEFTWNRDGQQLNGLDQTFSNLTFGTIRRGDAGSYTVSATNFVLDSTVERVGTDTGSFTLNVIYGPSFQSDGPTQMPTQRFALLDDRLSLVCGRGLDSNPEATITWTAPDGTTIMDNARYDLENGTDVVRLNFTRTILTDTGIWICDVVVRSQRHVVSNGRLVLGETSVIGSPIRHAFMVTVIELPGQPVTLREETVGATWIQFTWEAPLSVDFPITRYEVIARAAENPDVILRNMSTPNNNTFVNVTDLLPGTEYNFTVVAVIEAGEVVARGVESASLEGIMTGFTVPNITCPRPESSNGNITASWSYVHTGGRPLTGLSVTYSYEEGVSTVTRSVGVNLDDLMVTVSGLVAGEEYTFTVTAENINGSSSTACEPVNHIIGVPAAPQFGDLTPGPNPGVITVQIKTVASGVNQPNQNFRFNITPFLTGDRQRERLFEFPNYVSGQFVSIAVGQLEPGASYTFSATALNIFGNSESAPSPQAFAGGDSLPPPPTPTRDPGGQPSGNTSNSTVVAVGVAVPVIILAIVVIIAVIVILFVFLSRKGKTYRPKKEEGDVRYQPAPTSDSTTQVKEVSVDIGEPMTKDAEIQYAELDTFRPPSQQQKNGGTQTEPKPVEPEEPVEYAIITNFKKKEGDPPPAIIETSAVPDPTPDTTTSEGDADKTGTSTTLV